MTTDAQSSKSQDKARQSKAIMRIAFLAVSTVLVFLVTRLAAVPISAFNGQEFDLGDVMIFTFAWTFGPGVGAFAGGVGSALSDASFPSPFAPFTLVIKGAEGFLAGFVAGRVSPSKTQTRTIFGRRTLSWILASSVMVGGYFLTNWIGLGYGFLVGLYEVPFDILQVVAGGLIGGPVSRYLRNSLPAVAPFMGTLADKKQ
jgi:uncharacterized membrane protein